MYFGKGLVSKETYTEAYKKCQFPGAKGFGCDAILEKAFQEVGPHNIYNIYDDCPNTGEWLKRSGKSMRWLLQFLREKMNTGQSPHAELAALAGGYDWSCGGLPALRQFMSKPEVQQALHLAGHKGAQFDYRSSGPASITLYPKLVDKIRILIYNGDADACVPYKGNEEWTEGLAASGVVKQNKAWHPWFAAGRSIPAGYATTYTVPGSSKDFSFITIRLAGHMVPAFQPLPSLAFFERFISGTPF